MRGRENGAAMDSRAHLNNAICRRCYGTGEVLPFGAVQRVVCTDCEGVGVIR